MELVFWISVTLVAYPYVIYPVVLVAMNRLLRRSEPRTVECLAPSVSVILPVHNEAVRIEAKLRNLLDLDYPAAKLEILVIGDTPLDIRCARAIGAKVLAVATGTFTLDEVRAHKPDWAVPNLRGISLREVIDGK